MMTDKYTVLQDDVELGLSKGDALHETDDSYYYYVYNEDVSEGTVTTTSMYKLFPKEVIENNIALIDKTKSIKEEQIEKEVPIEEVKKGLQDDVINEPLIKRIKVILNFPGGKEGDVFEYSINSNTYIKQSPIDEDEYLSGLISGQRVPYIGALSVEEVDTNFDYFEDITPKVMKTKEQVMNKIADLAEQKLGLEKYANSDSTDMSKIEYNKIRKRLQIINKVIIALTWSIGEGKDFIVE